ncbi:MAG: hypothetical protein ABF587_06980 [Leuconostoc sp.]
MMSEKKHKMKKAGFWSRLSVLLAVGQLLFSVYHEIKDIRNKRKS